MFHGDDQKEKVQQATDLVRLVGEQVSLRPRGKEFVGLCPFHDDKNPSLYVSPSKQIYKCFSCGAGGDVFSFVINYHKMTFVEALRHLAEKAGIKLEERRARNPEREGPSDRQLAMDAHSKATAFFQAVYRHGEHGKTAREYVAGRDISPDMIEAFQIGYAPDRWDGLALTIGEKAWDTRGFELAGLITARDRDSNSKSHYDRFRHRLIFPICDALGRTIAFGGRKLREEDEPKYLNSPESVLFNKSATLYGLHLAKKPIIDGRTAVIVEGYTDVIACHQHGVRNVVATLGTALTAQHVTELRRYCEKVVLIYDADEAGIKAADRAVEVFLTEELDVAIAVLPEEMDPAELLELPDGLEKWNRSVATAADALVFLMDRMSEKLGAAGTITGRQKLAEEYLRRLAQLGWARAGVVRRAMIAARLAAMLRLPEATVIDLLKKATPAARAPERPNNPVDATPTEFSSNLAQLASPAKIRALHLAERHVLGCLIRRPDLFHTTTVDGRPLDEAMTPADLVTPVAQQLYACLLPRLSDRAGFTLASLLSDLAAQGQQDLIDLATTADLWVEEKIGEDQELLAAMLTDEARTILAFHRHNEYQRSRSEASAPTSGDQPVPGAGQDQMLRQVSEHHRTNPSPARFPRVRAAGAGS